MKCQNDAVWSKAVVRSVHFSVVYHWLMSGLCLSAYQCLGPVVVRRLTIDFDTVNHFYVCTVN